MLEQIKPLVFTKKIERDNEIYRLEPVGSYD